MVERYGGKAGEMQILHSSLKRAKRMTQGTRGHFGLKNIINCVLLEAVSGQMKDKTMTGTSQHGLIKG